MITVYYIIKQSGTVSCLNELTKTICLWCMGENIYLSTNPIEEKSNASADFIPRDFIS